MPRLIAVVVSHRRLLLAVRGLAVRRDIIVRIVFLIGCIISLSSGWTAVLRWRILMSRVLLLMAAARRWRRSVRRDMASIETLLLRSVSFAAAFSLVSILRIVWQSNHQCAGKDRKEQLHGASRLGNSSPG